MYSGRRIQNVVRLLRSRGELCIFDVRSTKHFRVLEPPEAMLIIEQHKLVRELKDYIGKMTSAERYDFEMMQRRDKDEE